MSTCERRAEWLDAWRAGRLAEEVDRRGPPCEACAQALASAGLVAAGHLEEAFEMDDDAVALAAVGLGEVELDDAEDAAWLAALSAAPAGELPPAPEASAAAAEAPAELEGEGGAAWSGSGARPRCCSASRISPP
ncbi:MAG: hypothetical protein H6704_20000 [Myxococcales bacterium]|nr:hypothetical protein [Myxococcales bacterium]